MLPDAATRERAPAANTSHLARRLDQGLVALALPLPKATRDRLIAFIDLLQQWNRVYNLTSVRDPADMLTIHVLDALAVLPVVEEHIGSGRLLDIGSGAGLPGIPLAIARPDWMIESVDAVAKKIAFQIRAKQLLRLNGLHPIHVRVEALTLAAAPAVVIARAFASMATLVQAVASVADHRTTIVAMKGARPDVEIDALPSAWRVERTVPLDVPFLGAERCAVVLKRT